MLMRSTQKAGVPLLQSTGCSDTAPSGLALPCSPTLPPIWDIVALHFRGGTDQPFLVPEPSPRGEQFHLNSQLIITKYVLKQKYPTCMAVLGREAGMRWGCVSRGAVGSVLPHWCLTGVTAHHPSCKSLPPWSSFQLLGQASLGGWEKGDTALNFPNATNNSFSFKASHPVLDREGVVGMEAGRVGQHLFPIHQGLIPFMSTIRQSVIKG